MCSDCYKEHYKTCKKPAIPIRALIDEQITTIIEIDISLKKVKEYILTKSEMIISLMQQACIAATQSIDLQRKNLKNINLGNKWNKDKIDNLKNLGSYESSLEIFTAAEKRIIIVIEKFTEELEKIQAKEIINESARLENKIYHKTRIIEGLNRLKSKDAPFIQSASMKNITTVRLFVEPIEIKLKYLKEIGIDLPQNIENIKFSSDEKYVFICKL